MIRPCTLKFRKFRLFLLLRGRNRGCWFSFCSSRTVYFSKPIRKRSLLRSGIHFVGPGLVRSIFRFRLFLFLVRSYRFWLVDPWLSLESYWEITGFWKISNVSYVSVKIVFLCRTFPWIYKTGINMFACCTFNDWLIHSASVFVISGHIRLRIWTKYI